jgi:TolB-like protein
MEFLSEIAEWIEAHETFLSGLGALDAIVVLSLSPLRGVVKRLFQSTRSTPSANDTRDEPIPRESDSGALPSIVVLPLRCLSDNLQAPFWADAVHRELTERLARVSGFFVVSHGSAMTYRDISKDVREIGRELGVRYAVEGTLQAHKEQIRITVDLIGTGTGNCDWSRSYDQAWADIDNAIDDLATEIVSHLGVQLTHSEARRIGSSPEIDPTAWELYQQAMAIARSGGWNREGFSRVDGLLRKAVNRDPEFALGHARLALNIAISLLQGLAVDTDNLKEEVRELADRAVELDDQTSEVLGYAGCALCDVGLHDRGFPLIERSIEINPSNAQAHAAFGAALVLTNRSEEGIPALEWAIRLSPKDPALALWLYTLGNGYLASGQPQEAEREFLRTVKYDPKFVAGDLRLARLYEGTGRRSEAQQHLETAKRLRPDIDTASRELLPVRLRPWGQGRQANKR